MNVNRYCGPKRPLSHTIRGRPYARLAKRGDLWVRYDGMSSFECRTCGARVKYKRCYIITTLRQSRNQHGAFTRLYTAKVCDVCARQLGYKGR